MNDQVRATAEGIARKTSRRGFFGRGADLLFGALTGVAAGEGFRRRPAGAGGTTECVFPGPPCACENCLRPDGVTSNGVCAKPCVILTQYYASGCWVSFPGGFTCCDCTCPDIPFSGWCGCGSDHHNNPSLCPEAA
ncbi:MAG: hypothetical protein U1B78_04995 [Dehalococcoidia bacterium]|nr:hypothetical protein [Dehalococcoidia bacterium]